MKRNNSGDMKVPGKQCTASPQNPEITLLREIRKQPVSLNREQRASGSHIHLNKYQVVS
jgi:hypothetical protein